MEFLCSSNSNSFGFILVIIYYVSVHELINVGSSCGPQGRGHLI